MNSPALAELAVRNESGAAGAQMESCAALENFSFEAFDLRFRFRVLDPFEDHLHDCDICESQQTFRAGWECEFDGRGLGKLGICLGCGAVKIAGFTRTNSLTTGKRDYDRRKA